MRTLKVVCALLILVGTCSVFNVALRAQTAATAGLIGTVKDPSGAVVADAQVTVTNTDTNEVRTTTTNENGQYALPGLVPGAYNMSVTKTGFQAASVSTQHFDAARSYTVDVNLTVGSTSQTVEVNAAGVAVELQTTDAQVGNTLEQDQFQNLPTLTRDSYELLALQPGAMPQFNNRGSDTYGSTGGGVSGALSDQNAVTLDGLDISGEGTGGVSQLYPLVLPIPVEGVSEFRVGVANQNASFGRTSGGQVSMSSASGGNTYHGTAYWFNQNSIFNANTWDNDLAGNKKATNRDNRGGLAVGGPIQKDKTFVFANVEFRRFFQGVPYAVVIPSDQYRLGNVTSLSPSVASGCTAATLGTGSNNAAETCNVAAFDPRGIGINSAVQSLWSFFPATCAVSAVAGTVSTGTVGTGSIPASTCTKFAPGIIPTGSGISNGSAANADGVNTVLYQANLPAPRADNTGAIRFDHNFNANLHMFARFQYSTLADAAGAAGLFQYDIAKASGGDGQLLSQFAQRGMGTTLGLDQVIRPNLINSIRAGWLVQHNDSQSIAPHQIAAQYGISALNGPDGFVSFLPQSVAQPIGVDGQTAKHTHILTGDTELKDDLTWVKGTHSLTFGGDFIRLPVGVQLVDHFGQMRNDPDVVVGGNDLTFPAADIPAGITAGTNQNTWKTFYSTALGMVENTSVMAVRNGQLQPLPLGTDLTLNGVAEPFYFYASDTWRMKPSITLTYGLGYTFMEPFVEQQGKQGVLVNYSAGNQIINSGAFLQQKLSAALLGQAYSPTLAYEPYGVAGVPGFWYPYYGDVAPRVSVAWSPSSSNGLMGKILGQKKTAIRGGYSMVYDRIGGNAMINQSNAPSGFSQNMTVNFPTCGTAGTPGLGCMDTQTAQSSNSALSEFRVGTDGILPVTTNAGVPSVSHSALTTIPVFAAAPIPFVLSGNAGSGGGSIGTTLRPGREHLIDFTIQRQLSPSQTLEVGYIGRLGRGLYQGANVNAVPYMFTDPASGQTFAQAFDAVANCLRAGTTACPTVPDEPWFDHQVPLAGLVAPPSAIPGAGGVGLTGTACTSPTATSTSCLASNSTIKTQFVNGQIASMTNTGTAPIDVARVYNQPGVGPLTPLTTAPAATLGSITVTGNLGRSNYNGVFIAWRNTGWHGLTYDVNYTFSKSLDNGLGAQAQFPSAVNGYYPGANYGFTTFDRTHVFNSNMRYSLPFGKGKDGIDRLIGGWYMSGIVTMSSGLPLVVSSSNQGWAGSAVQPLPNVSLSTVSIAPHANPSAGGIQYFTNPSSAIAAYSFNNNGTTFQSNFELSSSTVDGRGDTLRGFSTWNVDARFGKKTSITERIGAEFSADFFNAFNHPTFTNPSVNLGTSNTFGTTSTTYVPANRVNGARWIQLGLQISF